MGSYFRPLRRKIGVATLAVACAFMGGWVRSMAICEQAYCPIGQRTILGFGSFDGIFMGACSIANTSDYLPKVSNWHQLDKQLMTVGLNEMRWMCGTSSFGIGFRDDNPEIRANAVILAPYWSIVIPLTAISAWMLLSKIRNPKRPIEAAPSKGVNDA